MPRFATDKVLEKLRKQSFNFFLKEYNPKNGLIRDRSEKDSDCSIASVGFGLAVYLVGVERGYLSRNEALQRILVTARFFASSVQSTAPDATGYHGFYYHFLDMKTGRRAGNCELSTVDTALLLLGFLTAAEYFSGDSAPERELREWVDLLYSRVDWNWVCNGQLTATNGYLPRHGFIKYRWTGYNEGILIYLLGLGAPTHRLPSASYTEWTKTYEWKEIYGHEYLHAGPLFIHQFLHTWLDLRGVQDDYMRAKKIDYFENSRRATYIQREYAIRNPHNFARYSAYCWGLTASDGPGPARRSIDGKRRNFFGYRARGVPFGPDDGTISPWAVVTSLPFAPEIVLPTIQHFYNIKINEVAKYGFRASFNPTYHDEHRRFWMSPCHFGLNQGPMILMIENYETGLIWQLTRRSKPLIEGLRRARFAGSWLGPLTQHNAQKSS